MRACLLPLTTLIALANGIAQAEDRDYWQLRVGMEPGIDTAAFSVDQFSPLAGGTYDVESASSLMLGVGYRILDSRRRSGGAVSVLAELQLGNYSGDGQVDGTISVQTLSLNLGLDFLYRIGHETPIYLGAGPRFGLGYARMSADEASGSGYFAQAGLGAVGYWQLDRFLLGVEAGFTGWMSNISAEDDNGSGFDVVYRGKGLSASFTLGYEF